MKFPFLTLTLFCVAMFITTSCSKDDKDEETTSEKTYKVGDLYQENGVKGIVYKLTDDSGKHGLVVSLDETRKAWAISTADRTEINAKDENDGAKNMKTVAAIVDWRTNYPAFAWCAAKNTNGVSGWTLPAYNQLKALYAAWIANKETLNKALTDHGGVAIIATNSEDEYYWSSTEDSSVFSLAFMFSQGVVDFPLKDEVHKVRAVFVF